jgi:gliding motility-associated-like protein
MLLPFMKKYLLITLLFFAYIKNLTAQVALFNNGQTIKINSNAIVKVNGTLQNDVFGTTNGYIENNGTLYVNGDWINNCNNGALAANTGTVILDGNAQNVAGNQTTNFNNLTLSGSATKTLLINTNVGGVNGFLNLSNIALNLNRKTITITNAANNAISRTSGFIISESQPSSGYGTVKWNIGSNTGNYVFPFGTSAVNYFPLIIDKTTPGSTFGTASISASTYPTATNFTPNNRELPTGVFSFDNTCGKEHANKALDRFWVLASDNYSTQPESNITFSYLDPEWNTSSGSNNNINEQQLKAWNYSGSWQPKGGSVSVASNNLTVTQVNQYVPWVLAEDNQIIATYTSSKASCFGISNGSITSNASGGYGNLTYLWTPGNVTQAVYPNAEAGVYKLTITDELGCVKEISNILIEATSNPITVSAGLDVITDSQTAVELIAQSDEATSFTWSPNEFLSCLLCQQTSANPQTTQRYIVTARDANGCAARDTVQVTIDDSNLTKCGEVFVASAFSPNGDGQNDFLGVQGNCIQEVKFEIYNRWGEKVFQSRALNGAWDGTFNGETMNTGVFVYYVTAKLSDGKTVNKQGNVSILK